MSRVIVLGLDNFCGLVKDIGHVFCIVHPIPAQIGSSVGKACSSPSDNVTLKELISLCEQNMDLAFR